MQTPSIGSADVPMAVMKVGIMGVYMNQRFMPVNVAMGLALRVLGSMAMALLRNWVCGIPVSNREL